MMGVAAAVQQFFLTYMSQRWQFMLATVILFTINGMLVDGNVCILLFIPLLTPLLATYGINPVYYAAVVLLTIEIGNVTPPFCVTIYMAAKLCKVSFGQILKETIPFLIINYGVLLLVVLFPQISTFIVH